MKTFIFGLLIIMTSCQRQKLIDIVVIGDGTGAITAALQSSRSGVQTLLITTIPWLGGMLTSAGVSAIDGNHQLPAGLWGEFRDSIYARYGGPEKVATGWVSNTHFEPHIGNEIFQNMVKKEANLKVIQVNSLPEVSRDNNSWLIKTDNSRITIKARILVDGTDLGDIAAMVGAEFDIGMEAKDQVEELAGTNSNGIIQDLTYVAILEESSEKKVIVPSSSYDPALFYCACEKLCNDVNEKPHDCQTMMDYAKLPNNKYLINWPLYGNDIYLNIVQQNQQERIESLKLAKTKTLDFVYFIQNELGYDHLRLSETEFPTEDLLPYIPYHREGRRFHGKVRFLSKHIKFPDDYKLARTGIAVGNYPIDHHHKERKDIEEIDFPLVPAFSIPLGSLIPVNTLNLIIADKPISVSNIANGTTRLQPVIMQVGQVAGLLAAEAIKRDVVPSELSIRKIQSQILEYGGYISPFHDLKKENVGFKSAQKIAACGLIDLEERPYKWANETLFHPDSLVLSIEVDDLLSTFYEFSKQKIPNTEKYLSGKLLVKLFFEASKEEIDLEKFKELLSEIRAKNINLIDLSENLTRLEYVYLLDNYLDPFESRDVDFEGNWINIK